VRVTTDSRQTVTGLLLCGGEGRRLGGADKPLQALAGRPLLEYVVQALRPQVARIIVSANRTPERYQPYGEAVVDDGRHRGRGPLAGIAAGLAAAAAGPVLCVPGDAPHLPSDLLARLAAARAATGADIACVDDGAGPQPLCCLLDASLLSDLQVYLDGGGRTPRHWYQRHRCAVAHYAEWPRWGWSINTPEEWSAAEAQLRAGQPA